MSSDIQTETEPKNDNYWNDLKQNSESIPESSQRFGDNGQNELAGFESEISEIEEERLSEIFEVNSNGVPLSSIREEVSGSLSSFDFHNSGDVVYVAIWKSEDTSMDALRWTISHSVEPLSTLVFLIHIFPETKQIPTPLGMMPIDNANPTQKETYLAQERGKRRDYLQKFINVCSNSKVRVDTILIESNMEAKAILDLIPILSIRKLILGTSKRSIIKSRKVSGAVGQILNGAPEYCEVTVVCEGKEMVDLMADISYPQGSSNTSPHSNTPQQHLPQVANNAYLCGTCFKPKVVN